MLLTILLENLQSATSDLLLLNAILKKNIKEKCQLFANKTRRIYYLCFVYFMLLLLLFYMILDRRGLTNTVLCVQRYIHIILRSGCIAHGKAYPPLRTPSSFFYFFLLLSSLVSVLLLLAASLVHVIPWPTSCQPSQLASAPGNFSFRIKLRGISCLPSLLFLVFLPFPLSDLSLKLWLFVEYKRNILPKIVLVTLTIKSLIWDLAIRSKINA